MRWIVLVDMRRNNGHCAAIEDSNGYIAQFETLDDAAECLADHVPEGAFSCTALDLDTGVTESL